MHDGLFDDPDDSGTGKPRRQVVFEEMHPVPWVTGTEAAYCRTMGSPSDHDDCIYGPERFAVSRRRKKDDPGLFA